MCKKITIISILFILLTIFSSMVLATNEMSNMARSTENVIDNTMDAIGNAVEDTWDTSKNVAGGVSNVVENTASSVSNAVKNTMDTSENDVQKINANNATFLGMDVNVWIWLIIIVIAIVIIVLICKYMKEHNDKD